MKLKKYMKAVLVAIGILFLIVCLGITIKEYLDVRTEEVLNEEVSKINHKMTISNIEKEKTEIDNGVLKTKGNYQKIEEAYKKYCQKYYEEATIIHQNYKKLLTDGVEKVENIEADQPDLLKTSELLTTEINNIEQENKNYQKLVATDTILSYIDKDLKTYYVNYYKELISSLRNSKITKQINKELTISLDLVNKKKELIEFLQENKEWSITEEELKFTDEEKQSEYQTHIDSIKIIIKDIE